MKLQETLCAIALFLAVLPVKSSAGDATRGGAQVVYINGTERLRDIVDPSACDLKSGSDLRAQDPGIDKILNKLSELDPYFASGLKNEINQLNFCFTTALVELEKNDSDSVIAYDPIQTGQIAIRFLGTHDVYVNNALYQGLTVEDDRSFMPIHEAMHTFIPVDVPMRNLKLRTAVQAVRDVMIGKTTTADRLHYVLNWACVKYPSPQTAPVVLSPTEAQSPQHLAIQFALSPIEDQAQMLIGAKDLNPILTPVNMGEFLQFHDWDEPNPDQGGDICNDVQCIIVISSPTIHHHDPIYPGIPSDHLFILMASNPSQSVISILKQSTQSLAVLNRIINPPDDASVVTVLDPLLLVLSASEENPKILDPVLTSKLMQRGPNLYGDLWGKAFSISLRRVVASPSYALLGIDTNADGENPGVLGIAPFTIAKEGAIPDETETFIKTVAHEASRGDEGWKILDAMVFKNQSFYSAFGVTDLKAQLEALNLPVRREKSHLLNALSELIYGFRTVLLDEVSRTAGQDSSNRVGQNINWAQLGLRETK